MAEALEIGKETEIVEDHTNQILDYEKIIKEKDIEIAEYKKKICQLEIQVIEAQKLKAQRNKENQEVEQLKNRSHDALTKAKSIIFENTKVIKNQELQIEAYGQQIESLKDVVQITKDLLEIRSLEVKQLETKINCIEEKTKAERERQELVHKKLENMIRHNGALKREYETQLCLFQALRERYNERELARGVVDDLREEIRQENEETVKENEETVKENGSVAPNTSENTKNE